MSRIPSRDSSLNTSFRLLVIVVFSALIGGCAVGEFIGAYFNTYYNARRQFNEAEAELLAPVQTTGRTTEKPFLAPFEVPAGTKTKLTAVIEKCSKLLQYHPDSKLVDDALLMIGKCYYYQNEHQSAERKFKELIDGYPASGLAFEAKLLLANTYYRMKDKPVASTAGKELVEVAMAERENGIVAQASLLVAHIEFENKNYPQALEYYKKAAEFAGTSEERSDAYRKVAEMHAQQGEYVRAGEAYLQAENETSDYVAQYKARFGYARMLSKTGESDKSLKVLESLLKNNNNRDYFSEVDLEIANVYRDMKDYPSALAQYQFVDTAYARTEVAANSYYESGLIYETRLFQYDSARAHYNRGRGEFPQAPVTPLLIQRGDLLNRYTMFISEIARNDSLRWRHLVPDSVLAKLDSLKLASTPVDTTQVVRGEKPDSLSVKDSTLAHRQVPVDSLKPRAPARPSVPLDTVEARLALNKTEIATLFYTGLEVIDSAKHWYHRVLDEHPKSTHVPRAMFILAQIYRQDSTARKSTGDSLLQEVVTRYPESEFAAESRRLLGVPPIKKGTDPAEESYARGEELMRSGKHAAAIDTFRSVVKRHPTSSAASRSQYAIGWLYEQKVVRPDSAISNYKRLVDTYPNSQYVALVRPKLQEVDLKLAQEKAVEDSIKLKRAQEKADLDSLNAKKSAPEQETKKDSVTQPQLPPGLEQGVEQLEKRGDPAEKALTPSPDVKETPDQPQKKVDQDEQPPTPPKPPENEAKKERPK